MAKAATWADGFGRWHAIVADTPDAEINAIEAITGELWERYAGSGARFAELRAGVAAELCSIPNGAEAGFVHFIEYPMAGE